MTVRQILVAPAFGAALMSIDEAEVVAGQGLVGDRHFGLPPDDPGLQFTLVEAEAIERFNAAHGTRHPPSDARRNVVTAGVSLRGLIGRRFSIGSAQFRGVEVCEPCLKLGQRLATPGVRPAAVVRWFLEDGGLRADVLSSGRFRVGDPIRPID
jgi:MOSC domain-containing protein YiiM